MAEPLRLPLYAPLLQRDATSDKDALASNIFYDSVENTTFAVKRPGIDTLISGLGEAQGIFSYQDTIYTFYTLAAQNTPHALGTGDSKFIAVYTGGFSLASNSTVTEWTKNALPDSRTWSAVAYKSPTFVAIAGGASSICASSPDGITWTARTMPAARAWTGIVSNGTIFVAVCSAGGPTTTAATSTDGFTWTARTIPSAEWQAVAWNGSVFCAVSTSGSTVAATSPDGVTWTARTLPFSGNWNSIAWNGTVFLAVHETFDGTQAATSPNGITWTTRTIPAGQYRSVAWNGSVFCMISRSTNVVATSPDGITWTSSTISVVKNWLSVSWNGSTFASIGSGGDDGVTKLALSTNGTTWTVTDLTINNARNPIITSI
jgi:hypothetical protein